MAGVKILRTSGTQTATAFVCSHHKTIPVPSLYLYVYNHFYRTLTRRNKMSKCRWPLKYVHNLRTSLLMLYRTSSIYGLTQGYTGYTCSTSVLLRVDRRRFALLVVLPTGSTTRVMRPSKAMLSSRAPVLGAREL